MRLLGKVDVAIDVGDGFLSAFVKGRGLVFCERVGEAFPELGGKDPDLKTAIAHCLDKAEIRHGLFKPFIRSVLVVDSSISDSAKNHFVDAAFGAGIKKVFLMERPMAAAIGAGVKVSEPRGRLVVDIGRKLCEVAAISLAGNVAVRSVYPPALSGGNGEASTGPQCVSTEDIAAAIKGVMADCKAQGMRNLVADLLEDGAVLTGVGASEPGIAERLSEETGLKMRVAANSLSAAVEGAGLVLDELDYLSRQGGNGANGRR